VVFLVRFLFVVLCVVCWSELVFAQVTITPTRNLSFGEALFFDNNAVRTIEISVFNTFTADSEYNFVTDPVSGVYTLNGASAFDNISVSATVTGQPTLGPQTFTIDNLVIDAPAQTDGTGQAVINLGGRLRSSGNGTTYSFSQVFTGTIELEVSFP